MKRFHVTWRDEAYTGLAEGDYYLASEVDAVLKRQASAAISGMNAAKAISSHQLELARKLSAESKPEAIDSERIANDLLTQECENKDARIAELGKALVDLVTGHNGYHLGAGPCICAAHEEARRVLGMTRDDVHQARSSERSRVNEK